jgi:hypothetical protein
MRCLLYTESACEPEDQAQGPAPRRVEGLQPN